MYPRTLNALYTPTVDDDPGYRPISQPGRYLLADNEPRKGTNANGRRRTTVRASRDFARRRLCAIRTDADDFLESVQSKSETEGMKKLE